MDPTDHPDIKNWAEGFGGQVDYFDFAVSRMGMADWLAVARVFRPEFVTVEDCILWKRAYNPDNYRMWQNQLGGDSRAIEATLNRLGLWQLFEWPEDEFHEAAALGLAQDISVCWESALNASFPQLDFDVSVTTTDDGPVVSFVTLR